MIRLMSSQKSSTIRILCKYERLQRDKNVLPVFICFKADKHLLITLPKTTKAPDIKKLLKLMSEWFVGLKVIKIENK